LLVSRERTRRISKKFGEALDIGEKRPHFGVMPEKTLSGLIGSWDLP